MRAQLAPHKFAAMQSIKTEQSLLLQLSQSFTVTLLLATALLKSQYGWKVLLYTP
jgi:hypothetical protein